MKKLIVLAIIGLTVYIAPKGYIPAPMPPFHVEEWTYYEWGPGSYAADQYRETEKWLKKNERQWRREMKRRYRRR